MDIYHETLMHKYFVYGIDTENKNRINQQYKFDDHILVKQLDDINKTKYTLVICNKAVSKIVAIDSENQKEINLESFEDHFGNEYQQDYFKTHFFIDVEFKKYMPSKIILYFIKDIVSPIEIPIEYEYANEEAYYERKEKEKIDHYKEAANISVKTGSSLVNISFRKCDSTYDKTEVELYSDDNLCGTFTNKKGMFVIPIKELATGTYHFKLTQFDKDGNKLFTSNLIEFTIYPSISDDDDDDYWNEYDDYPC